MGDPNSRSEPSPDDLGHILSIARRMAIRHGANNAEADEVAQSTVVRFWLRWDTAPIQEARRRTSARWDAYVRQSALNIYRDRIREHQRRMHRQNLACTSSNVSSYRAGMSTLSTSTPCPVEELVIRTRIADEVAKLPTAGQRRVAFACFMEDKTPAEVAADLGIQPQAVRKHLRAARAKLIERLSE